MLTKAILTGVVLSAITGSIVYFGTEGADANITDTRELALAQGTELAGAPDEVALEKMVAEKVELAGAEDVETAVVEAVETAVAEDVKGEMTEKASAFQGPPREGSKPKTKWLDQYLKRNKRDTKPDADEADEAEVEVEIDSQSEATQDEMSKAHTDRKNRKRIRIKRHVKDSHSKATATGSYVVEKEVESDAGNLNSEDADEIDLESLDLDALDLDGDIDVEVLKKQLGVDGKENVDIRIIKKIMKGPKGNKRHMKGNKRHMKDTKRHLKGPKGAKPQMTPQPMTIDYDMVLEEAKKLIVTDMRNQAVLEIIDYAVDNRDMSEAADLVEELSTPELRDTARARIGAGLARCGKPEAAFAVIDELEIDELAAPIRLEIITALMATQKERRIAGIRR